MWGRVVLRILFCALGFGVVLGGALVLNCIWDLGVGSGRCLCIVVLEGLRRLVEKWFEGVGGSIGCEVWG